MKMFDHFWRSRITVVRVVQYVGFGVLFLFIGGRFIEVVHAEVSGIEAIRSAGTQAGERREIRVGEVTVGFRWVIPGTFFMGSRDDEPGRDPAEVRHSVRLTRGFWIAETETTQPFFIAVMGENPSAFVGDLFPVDSVSWDDAVAFCDQLNALAGLATESPHSTTGAAIQKFRLPTEAEWEYACRAGTETPYAGPLDEVAWFDAPTATGSTHPVATKSPNDWGLFDMHGNLWEWTADGWSDFTTEATTDPFFPGPNGATGRIDRGGCWDSSPDSCRSAVRGVYEKSQRGRFVGFRVLIAP